MIHSPDAVTLQKTLGENILMKNYRIRFTLMALFLGSFVGCRTTAKSSPEKNNALLFRGGAADSKVVILGNGDSFTVQLACPDSTTQTLWHNCATRHVWFEVENRRGEKVDRVVDEILPAESSEGEAFQNKDPTTFSILLAKIQGNEFAIQEMNNPYSGLKVLVPGRYLLRVNVNCYDSHNCLIFSGKTAAVELNLRRTAIEPSISDSATARISLLVAPKDGIPMLP